VAPEVEVPKSATVNSRANVAGPALTMVGCARSQDDVAALIAAVGDIDGVTRVLVEKSEKSDVATTTSPSIDTADIEEDCRTRNSIAQFALVAAFDSVVAPAGSGNSTATAAATPVAASTTATTDTTTTATGETTTTDPTVVPEEQQQQQNVEGGISKANKAAGLVGAGDGG